MEIMSVSIGETNMLPSFIVVGAQKAGTSVIQLALREHPGIFMPGTETPFFEDPDYEQQTLADLEHLFDEVPNSRVCGIKRPSYLGSQEVAPRIKHDLPDVKLLACLRNPVDRFVSAYYHMMRDGFLPVAPVETGFRGLMDGTYERAYKRSRQVIEFGYYHKHLTHYLQYFDREQMHIVLYDTLSEDPVGVLQQMFAFLGVDRSYIPQAIHERPQANIYSLGRLRLHTIGNRFKYSYTADRTRLDSKPVSAVGKIGLRAINVLDGLFFSSQFKAKPAVFGAQREQIYALYADDIGKLAKLLNVDLTHWR
jgi:hypothetical protein